MPPQMSTKITLTILSFLVLALLPKQIQFYLMWQILNLYLSLELSEATDEFLSTSLAPKHLRKRERRPISLTQVTHRLVLRKAQRNKPRLFLPRR
jgi:hypothetical protein